MSERVARKSRTRTQPIDLTPLQQAARGRWAEILSSLTSIPLSLLDGRHHPCPKCVGKDRFRHLVEHNTGACYCNQCFKTGGGDGIAVIRWMNNWSFRQTITELCQYLSVDYNSLQPGSKSGSKHDPAANLDWRAWNDNVVRLWCRRKPPITPAAIQSVGGRLARYRNQYTVIALPIWGRRFSAKDPVGWCLYNSTGGNLPIYTSNQIEMSKIKLTSGSQAGIISPPGGIAHAQTIWKTEGPSDLLALLSLNPHESVGVCCNTFGAGENAARNEWIISLFRGKTVYIVHDCDKPGQEGATIAVDSRGRKRLGWGPIIAEVAAECRNVVLPYPITENHGKDLRDWIMEGHTYEDLVNLATNSVVIPADAAKVNTQPVEGDDDPHRLAKVNLDRYATTMGGRTLRYWRDEWWSWKGSLYRKMTVGELRAKLCASIKTEFDRLAVEKVLQYEERKKHGLVNEDGSGPPQVKKVSMATVSNVMQATSGLVTVPSDVELNTWLPTKERREYIALQDGILDVRALLAGQEECRLVHSPQWFSTVCLPYAFDPDARCPKWEKMLEHNLEMDPERIKILQEWAGYLLTSDLSEQKFMVCEGEGANGKSVFVAGLTAMLGRDNVSNVSLEVFGDRFSRTDTVGKLLNAAADCGDLDKVAEGYIKSFASGDRMYFDRKNLPGINAAPTAKLMICCNNRPRLSDKSDGIWRRMLLIPWRVRISEEIRIKGMDSVEWWQKSGELPGIFRWALAGLYRLRQQGGFTKSSLMDLALQDYQEDSSPARGFMHDYLAEGSSKIRAVGLYSLYRKWCTEHGYMAMSDRTFGKELRKVFPGMERVKFGSYPNRIWVYVGIKFQTDEISGEKTSESEWI